MSDCMLDLETFGNRSNAVIVAVGAVKFNPATKTIIDKFYSRVDPNSCMEVGMQVDADTIRWWLQQPDSARKEFFLEAGKLPVLKDVLIGFATWFKQDKPYCTRPGDASSMITCKGGDMSVWGNGATFDNVILSNAYSAAKIEKPWKYNRDRCYRTVKALYPDVQMKNVGVHHKADDDAMAQALHLMEIWPRLRAA